MACRRVLTKCGWCTPVGMVIVRRDTRLVLPVIWSQHFPSIGVASIHNDDVPSKYHIYWRSYRRYFSQNTYCKAKRSFHWGPLWLLSSRTSEYKVPWRTACAVNTRYNRHIHRWACTSNRMHAHNIFLKSQKKNSYFMYQVPWCVVTTTFMRFKAAIENIPCVALN